MTKESRYDLIRSLCRKVRGTKIQVVTALPAEVREEARLAARHNDDEAIIDVDTEVKVISRALAAIVKPETGRHAKHAHVDEVLTVQERGQLARDLAEYRKTHPAQPSYNKRLWLWIVPADPFESMKKAEPVGEAQTIGV